MGIIEIYKTIDTKKFKQKYVKNKHDLNFMVNEWPIFNYICYWLKYNKIIKYMIKCNILINSQNYYNQTSLILPYYYDNNITIKELTKCGANLFYKDSNGITVIYNSIYDLEYEFDDINFNQIQYFNLYLQILI